MACGRGAVPWWGGSARGRREKERGLGIYNIDVESRPLSLREFRAVARAQSVPKMPQVGRLLWQLAG